MRLHLWQGRTCLCVSTVRVGGGHSATMARYLWSCLVGTGLCEVGRAGERRSGLGVCAAGGAGKRAAGGWACGLHAGRSEASCHRGHRLKRRPPTGPRAAVAAAPLPVPRSRPRRKSKPVPRRVRFPAMPVRTRPPAPPIRPGTSNTPTQPCVTPGSAQLDLIDSCSWRSPRCAPAEQVEHLCLSMGPP